MPSDGESASDAESKKLVSSGKELTTKRRTKTGCLTCRKRRIKCGEERPICKNCIKSKRECAGYNQPLVYKPHTQSRTESEPAETPSSSSAYLWPLTPHDITHIPLRYSHPPPLIEPYLQPAPDEWRQGGLSEWTSSSNVTPPQLNDYLSTRSMGDRSSQEPLSSYQSDQSLRTAMYNRRYQIASQPNDTLQVGGVPGIAVTHNSAATSKATSSAPTPARNHMQTDFMQNSSSASSKEPQSQTSMPGDQFMYRMEADDDSDDPWDVDLDGDDVHGSHGLDQTVSQSSSSTHAAHLRPSLMSDGSCQFHLTTFTPPFFRTSPLLEEKSQRILQHFVSVTGPCMSVSNRNYYVDDSGSPRTIWTHGLPAMALKFPALAHAILALSAMHMSKLGLCNENTAVKHFTLALKRVGKALSEPEQRLQVSTLATVLLLGYYEVMTGDHSRWNLHLSGAGRLVMEHDYASMMRTMRRMQEGARINVAQPWIKHQKKSMRQDPELFSDGCPQWFDVKDWKVDQDLVAKLVGSEVNYDVQMQPNFVTTASAPNLNSKSPDDWMILVELYWWYCKQDVFMSMLSGDPLLLPYTQWKFCPPRGPVNDAEKSYATIDHLWLLIGRLVDFGGKDRKRKQQVINSQGGHWIPPPGFLGGVGLSRPSGRPDTTNSNPAESAYAANRPAPPSANEGRARKARQMPAQQPPQQPLFYGMIPPVSGSISMPSSFNVIKAELQATDGLAFVDAEPPQSQDLKSQTQYALEEHARITEAFDLFESLLSSSYHPLAPTDIQIATPFGPALQYQTPGIAGMWTFFYVGRILLHRLHPYSPPAAMVSAGVNAHKTHDYAQLVGRICGGLFARHTYLLQAGHVDHNLSAVVIETTLSLLFAAVQYQDPDQRSWTISKLTGTAQVTGWQTAIAMAGACETTWEKVGLAGKGPQYRRTMDPNNPNVRPRDRFEELRKPSDTMNLSPTEEHQSRFVSHDRSLIDRHASTRTYWALGLLSAEEDMQRITLGEHG